ncbi:glycosyltransferase family 4 protein [Nordella sp. HKS 07]|uniref:glycosyltransferase family 4 protein n=1 Tax=Nordella sp. HKS 07 TaxID=2712222 RepID=UPI0013E10EBB|nr:glycosyltransferase family 4 protein [Nordella sp. HKS 07]QIG49935.1 glycosyltransferase family 4 protein [Nordella sp. HKS 07]
MEDISHPKAVVCFPFVGDVLAGSHISALGLVKNLAPTGFQPLVVLHKPEGPLAELLTRENVTFVPAPMADTPERMSPRNGAAVASVLRLLPSLVRFLRNNKVAVVHTNDGRAHIIWGLAAKLAGAKLLWHHRGDPDSFGLRYLAPWLADSVVSVSKFASPRPGLLSAARKCTVIHSPFDLQMPDQFDRAACRERVLAELQCPPDTKLLGYVGSLVERKRPLLFVDTLAALSKHSPNEKFIGLLLGNSFNGLDELCRARAESLGVSDKIRLLGFRYPGEPWMAALDALLVPAVNEPLGRTLVEAMLLGTPVIATRSGGNPEAIRHNETGVLVEPEDPVAFARAIAELFQHPDRVTSMVGRARADAHERFGAARHVTSVTQTYDNLLRPQ